MISVGVQIWEKRNPTEVMLWEIGNEFTTWHTSLIYQRCGDIRHWFTRGVVTYVTDLPEVWWHMSLIYQRCGDIRHWFTRGVVTYVTDLPEVWWHTSLIYQRCGDICHWFTRGVVTYVTDLPEVWWPKVIKVISHREITHCESHLHNIHVV